MTAIQHLLSQEEFDSIYAKVPRLPEGMHEDQDAFLLERGYVEA